MGQGDIGGSAATASTAGAVVRELPIINKRGLHARASAKFVSCADRFDATIKVSRAGETVDARSIMGLMMLAAGIGTSVTLTATGPDAEEAVEALAALVADRFGEGE
ncbi:HPr family phosphocarrier protein [Phreatobacter oligotrophus]|jgi:phosphocarrier protein|uniref:Phosphocarrier protein n=1 Tax=Phreatobacter oligotrophus TaxID=1122261 RepID=A0A2T4ZE46_9HYPH|nr:HPr family phosphocarrier protein [Phreatobacter oligotrophus]PTM60168.1 phosphocarrier protein [Phreatobacter oligotrophus]